MASIGDIYTAEEISQEICEDVGDVSDNSKARAYRAMNRALRIIAAKGSWPFFREEDTEITTVADQEAYSLKARIKLPRYLHMRDPARKLVMMELRDLRVNYPNNTETTGTPLFWRLKNFNKNSQVYQVALWPIPDDEYTIYVDADQNPTMFTDSEDDVRNMGLPEEMIETLIQIATAIMLGKTGDADRESRMVQALMRLDDDFYRLGMHPDDDLKSRAYSGENWIAKEDPILNPGQY